MAARNGEACSTRARNSWIRWNWRRVTDIPEPGETWIARETEIEQRLFNSMLQYGIIKKIGSTGLGCGTYVNVYETDETAYHEIQRCKRRSERSDSLLPCCANAWIKNERGVDGITCGACGKVHDRSDLDL